MQNYRTHVVEIRKLKDTSVFKTDVKQVFDFIRCSGDKKELDALVSADPEFQKLDRKAYEFISYYGDAHTLRKCKVYQAEGGTVDMCKALDEIFADGKALGEAHGKEIGRKVGEELGAEREKKSIIRRLLQDSISLEQIMRFCDCSAEYVERVRVSL